MKSTKKIIICAGFIILLMISWIVTISAKSQEEKQIELLNQAISLMNDGIYVKAVPLLEKAAELRTKHTLAVEAELKRAYLALINTPGYRSRYIRLLEAQLLRDNVPAEIYIEAANFYLAANRLSEAFNVFVIGIEKTGCEKLIELYESNRYIYQVNRVGFDHVTAIYNGKAMVQNDGLWGIARTDGTLIVPCVYEQVSTFSEDRAIVKKDGEIFAVDVNNNRLALLHKNASDFHSGFSENRFPINIDGVWLRATGDFNIGTMGFEELGMYSGGYAAAKVNGKWGVIDKDTKWLISAQYDDVVRDELGRCYGQGAVFVRSGAAVLLITDGNVSEIIYEDAKPFSQEGYAAVKKFGKWGFIDRNGAVIIDFIFDDALSFGQHLAAVKIENFWGYICKRGNIVIEPVFLNAKSFSGGSAPVLTERGWDFITLIEFR